MLGVVAASTLVMLAGCVTVHRPAGGSFSFAEAAPLPSPSVEGATGVSLGMPPLVPHQQDPESLDRLVALRDARLAERDSVDTPIGVGDVLEVSVPSMEELALRIVRVTGDGTIDLPWVGTVHALGRTEHDVRSEITTRLERLMYDPQVSVFVREYRSRQVAVLGSVGRPGTYQPASPSDSILDLIAMARGITDGGARQVVFIPRQVAMQENVQAEVAALAEAERVDHVAVERALRNVDPIVLNLRDMSADVTQVVLSLPVRPGDVIIIPEAGKVFLQGWVIRPGQYDISRDLTMLSVIAAAGGPSFPADMSAARLIRATEEGDKRLFDVDLQAVARGERPDVYLQNGDVIEVGATGPRLVAYGLYYFFASVFRVGAAVTVL